MPEPFNFEEIQNQSADIIQSKPAFLSASDGISLAYYSFIPNIQPKAVLIFYHGGGMWSNAFYQNMAQKLVSVFPVAVYLFDIRGHGNSQGPRGDAPRAEQVYEDVETVARFIKKSHPTIPLLLGGHSSGAGLVVNYAAWTKSDLIDGYILITPFLGGDSGTVRADQRFVKKVRTWTFIANALSGGKWFNHTNAVFFNYPEWVRERDPLLVPIYTTAMATATSPYNAKALFEKIKKPCAIFVGEADEQFIPSKISDFRGFLSNDVQGRSSAHIIANAKHLTIISKANEFLPNALDTFVISSTF